MKEKGYEDVTEELANFLHTVNILDFPGHTTSVAMTQLCLGSPKTAIDNI